MVDVSGNVLVGQRDQQQGGPLSGTMQIEYLLTPDGRWRWRVYSQTYQQLGAERNYYRTGMGIRYIRHFGTWRDLLPPLPGNEQSSNPAKDGEKNNHQK